MKPTTPAKKANKKPKYLSPLKVIPLLNVGHMVITGFGCDEDTMKTYISKAKVKVKLRELGEHNTRFGYTEVELTMNPLNPMVEVDPSARVTVQAWKVWRDKDSQNDK